MSAAALAHSSPFYQSFSFLEQNQQVPGSPLSPFYGRLSRGINSPNGANSPVAHVPEVGDRVYSGSPLLRQILRGGRV